MNKQKLAKCAVKMKADMRVMHGLLDNTPEMEDSRYLMLVCMMNQFRLELFANLAMIGVEIPMTERETAPGDGETPTKKRDWVVQQERPPEPWKTPVSQTVEPSKKNPFAGNGFGGKAW
jgi:hypothetical protein